MPHYPLYLPRNHPFIKNRRDLFFAAKGINQPVPYSPSSYDAINLFFFLHPACAKHADRLLPFSLIFFVFSVSSVSSVVKSGFFKKKRIRRLSVGIHIVNCNHYKLDCFGLTPLAKTLLVCVSLRAKRSNLKH